MRGVNFDVDSLVHCGALAGAGVLMVALAHSIGGTSLEYQETVRALERGPSIIFKSAADCEQKGFKKSVCLKSFDAAKTWENRFGYDSKEKCETQHPTCNRVDGSAVMSTVTIVGNTTMVNPSVLPALIFRPKMVAWQTATNDLSKVMPLYETKTPGVVVRTDGNKFNLSY